MLVAILVVCGISILHVLYREDGSPIVVAILVVCGISILQDATDVGGHEWGGRNPCCVWNQYPTD